MILIIDLLLPTTDAGVLAQLVGVIVGPVLTRRYTDGWLLVVGVTLVALAFMALRTLH